MKRLLCYFFLVLWALPMTAQEDEGYAMSLYHNERFHFSLQYPSEFQLLSESENGDGVTFVSDEGNHIRVYGGMNANTVFGTSICDEYQTEKQQLLDQGAVFDDADCLEQPYYGVDGFYVLIGKCQGHYFYRRTIWWDEKFATVELTFRLKDYDKYNDVGSITIYSLVPGWSAAYGYEHEEVLQWYVDGTTFTLEENIVKPNIGDFFKAFAYAYSTSLFMTAHEKILGVPDMNEEDIEEWIYDVKNGYLYLRMISDEPQWVEACYWNMDNGHKLFVVNHNSPNQLLMAFDYDPETHRALVAPDMFHELDFHPEWAARLPRKGKSIDVFDPNDPDEKMYHLLWSGHDFSLEQ